MSHTVVIFVFPHCHASTVSHSSLSHVFMPDPPPYLPKTYQLPSSDSSTQVTPKTSPDTRKKPSYTYPIKLRNVPKPQLGIFRTHTLYISRLV
ncbi:hypothetical protein EV359DRAFT_86455 [Lentinula novae-zelandiae]|nr:hypothetical protein EV359DRAFT_86455 [Lentinula novae-zelandiae]